jgi:epoxyqueuosine reductase
MSHETPDPSLAQLAGSIREWGRELGFQQVGIADVEVAADEERLMRWLDQGRHGAM